MPDPKPIEEPTDVPDPNPNLPEDKPIVPPKPDNPAQVEEPPQVRPEKEPPEEVPPV